MSKIMSFEEIEQYYDGEWVLIAYSETDEDLKVVKGKVIAHSVNKEDIYQALEKAGEQPLAIEYMGQVPEDLAFIHELFLVTNVNSGNTVKKLL